MNVEYETCCSNCIHCERTIPDDAAVEKSGMIAFHKCFFDRPEYNFYKGGCVLYKNRYDC